MGNSMAGQWLTGPNESPPTISIFNLSFLCILQLFKHPHDISESAGVSRVSYRLIPNWVIWLDLIISRLRFRATSLVVMQRRTKFAVLSV